jgi:hypothetical protein
LVLAKHLLCTGHLVIHFSGLPQSNQCGVTPSCQSFQLTPHHILEFSLISCFVGFQNVFGFFVALVVTGKEAPRQILVLQYLDIEAVFVFVMIVKFLAQHSLALIFIKC